jgi:predicted hotdog family 3-hydroxylacyl-ACP dehydratase
MALPEKIIAENDELLSLIPQRPPMVMIEKLHHCNGNQTISSLKVKEDNIFFKDGFLREPGLIENIAQTVAAGAGYRLRQSEAEGHVSIGVIGAVKNLIIHYLPKENEILITTTTVRYEVMDAAIIYGNIKSFDKFVAECEMKIFTKKG